MDRLAALDWQPPRDWMRISVIDSHTGGEPFRVVVDGLPEIPGATVLERRRFAAQHLDHLRRVLMWEPRGHADMYGGWIGPSLTPGSDLSVLFTHNDGFSTMCGHGIIALTKVVHDTGIITPQDEEPVLVIDTPAGQITARSVLADGRVTSTRFRNVASFVSHLDARVEVPGLGEVVFDVAFGGAFYAVVEATSVGLDLDDAAELIAAGRAMKQAISDSEVVSHPEHDDLGFLYGVIFTGPARDRMAHSRNVCIFADGEVDRSPTGTGVSARLAIAHARSEIGLWEPMVVESIVGSSFRGEVVATTDVNGVAAVIPEISGTAHIIGRSEYWLDPSDELGRGFLIGQ